MITLFLSKNLALRDILNVSPLQNIVLSHSAVSHVYSCVSVETPINMMISSILSKNSALQNNNVSPLLFTGSSFTSRLCSLSTHNLSPISSRISSIHPLDSFSLTLNYRVGFLCCATAFNDVNSLVAPQFLNFVYENLQIAIYNDQINQQRYEDQLMILENNDDLEWFDGVAGTAATLGFSPLTSSLFGMAMSIAVGTAGKYLYDRWKRFYIDAKTNNPYLRSVLSFVGGLYETTTNFMNDMLQVSDQRSYSSIFANIRKVPKVSPGAILGLIGVFCINTFCINFGDDSIRPYSNFLTTIFIAPVIEECYKVYFGADDLLASFEFLITLAMPWRICAYWMHTNLPNRRVGQKSLSLRERIFWHMGFNFGAAFSQILVHFCTASLTLKSASIYFAFVALAIVFEESYSDRKRSTFIKSVLVLFFAGLSFHCGGIMLFPGQLIGPLTNIIKTLPEKNLPNLLRALNDAVLFSYANNSYGFFLGKVSPKEFEVAFIGDVLATPSLTSEEVAYPTPFFVPEDAELHILWYFVDKNGITVEDKTLHWYVSGAAWNKLMHTIFGNIDSEIVDAFSDRNPQFKNTFALNPNASSFQPKGYARQYITTVAQLKSALANCTTVEQTSMLDRQYVLELDDYTIQREIKGRVRSIRERLHYQNPDVLNETGRDREAGLSQYIAQAHGRRRETKAYRAPVFDIHQKHRAFTDRINYYKVPLFSVRGDVVPKPTATQAKKNPMLVKFWISSTGHRCLPRDSRNPRKAVCGNESCRILMVTPDYSNYSIKDLQHLLDTCSLAYIDMKDTYTNTPPLAKLSDFIDPEQRKKLEVRQFVNGELTCSTPDQMQLIYPMFKRDKPLFRAMVNYLENGTLLPGETIGHLNGEFIRITSKGMTISQGLEGEFQIVKYVDDDSPDFLMDEMMDGIRLIRESGLISLSRFISMVFGLYKASSSVEMINIFFLYISSGDVADMPDMVIGAFKGCFKTVVMSQGSTPFTSTAGTMGIDALFDIFSSMSVWNMLEPFQYCDWPMVRHVVALIKLIMSKSRFREGETLVQKVLRFVLEGLKVVKKFIETRDWNVFFQPYDTLDSWKLRCDGILDHQPNVVADRGLGGDSDKEFHKLRKQGLIPSSWLQPFTEAEYEDELVRCITLGEEFTKLYRSTDSERIVVGYLHRLKAFKSQTNAAHNVMANRVAPLGISLVGAAGVGKTNIMTMIIKALARKNEFPLGSEFVHYLQLNSNFQDGANSTQWVWCADDIDQNPAPAVAGMENHCTWVIKIVNNAALPVESAAVDMKGKICARPLVYISTTNFDRPRLQGYLLFPPAYYRRLPIRIRVVPKPEFMKGTSLDPAKAQDSQTPDMWNFYVSTFSSEMYDETNPFACFPYAPVQLDDRMRYLKHLERKTYAQQTPEHLETPMNISQLLMFINDAFDDHLRQQKDLIARAQRGDRFCLCCLVDLKPDQLCGYCQPLVTVTPQGKLSMASKAISIAHSLLTEERLSFSFTAVALLVSAMTAKFAVSYGVNILTNKFELKKQEFVTSLNEVLEDVKVTKTKVVAQVNNTFDFLSKAAKLGATIGVAIQAIKLIRELYKRYYLQQAVQDNRTEKTQISYVRADQHFNVGQPRVATWTKEELLETAVNSLFRVYNVNTNLSMNCVTIAHDCVLMPKHAGDLGDKLIITKGDLECPVVLADFNMCRHTTDDFMLVRCSHLTELKSSILPKVWSDMDYGVQNFDECILVTHRGLISCVKPRRLNYEGRHLIQVDPCTKSGDCGSLYVARINNSWFIVAMHTDIAVSSFGGMNSWGTIITATALNVMGHSVQSTMQGTYCPLEQLPKSIVFTPCPEKKSEVAAAILQRGASVGLFGTAAPKIMGGTMKSKVHPTVFADEFRDLEEKWCGRDDYWRIPSFKGEMKDNRWESWYTNSLGALERTCPDECYLMLAVLDYLAPFKNTRRDGYRSLSENETIIGIPGSVINSVNMSTSTGLPFSTKKRPFFSIVDNLAHVDERFMSVWRSFKKVVTDGNDLPVPLSVCTPKDEPIKFSKAEKFSGRVFNVLPAAYNLVTKEESGPYKAYTRANWRLAESAVGINVGSNDMEDVKSHLATVDPELLRVEEADYEKIDKKTNGFMFHYSGFCFSGISWLIGCNWKQLRTMVLSVRHTIYVINNDMFQIGGENSSGGDLTVEINSMNNSLSNRYVHYRRTRVLTPQERLQLIDIFRRAVDDPSVLFDHEIKNLNFRVVYALMTYGDDLLKSHGKDGSLDREEELFRELGYVMTDGQKEKGLIYRSWEQVTFLKRRFYTHSSGLMFCPLEKKTLAKMLRISNDSTLTRTDHGAQLLTDCLRECVYHGEELYNYMLGRFEKVVKDYGLEGNAHIDFKTFEERLQEIRENRFLTWSAPDVVRLLV